MPETKLTVLCQKDCAAGKPWKVSFQGVAAVHSIVVEFYGCSGGIYRFFPRNRARMDVQFKHGLPGTTQMVVFARGPDGCLTDTATCTFEISAPTAGRDDDDDWHHQLPASAAASSAGWVADVERSLGQGATILPQQGKPPMAETFCSSAGFATYGVSANASVETSAPPQRAADPAEAMRQKLESRIMKRFD
jgi:hypothetical protein